MKGFRIKNVQSDQLTLAAAPKHLWHKSLQGIPDSYNSTVPYVTFFFAHNYFKVFFLKHMYVCVCMRFVYMTAGNVRDQKRESDPLELDLQIVGSCPMWVPVTELGPWGGAQNQ